MRCPWGRSRASRWRTPNLRCRRRAEDWKRRKVELPRWRALWRAEHRSFSCWLDSLRWKQYHTRLRVGAFLAALALLFAALALLFVRGAAAFFLGSGIATTRFVAGSDFTVTPASNRCSASSGGIFCFNFSTGSNRSPYFLARANTSSDSNTSKVGSPFLRQFSTSSHFTGVETVGRSFARNEYTHTVVLWSSFWLQSTSTLPVRSAFFMSETTSSGCCRSSNRASSCAKGLVWS